MSTEDGRFARGGSGDATFPVPQARSMMPDWYPDLLSSVASRISTGRQRAVTAANQELIRTYWGIGADILDRQQQQGWGAKVIDRLSADLRERFPESNGFSPRNLKYMRAFAQAWDASAIVQRPVAQLPWRHHIALLEKLKVAETREWYASAAVEHGWSRDVLVHQIESNLHDRAGQAITNFGETMPLADSDLAQQSTRDPYLFEFVGTAEPSRV